MTKFHFHQFDFEYASAHQVLKALPKHMGKRLGFVCQFACASGVWLAAAQALGAERIMGIDSPEARLDTLCIPRHLIATYDLGSVSVSLPKPADLVLSIQHLQQLPPERAEHFIQDLCKSGQRVLFGALAPFQISSESANLQWPSYWARLFARHDFFPDLRFRPAIWSNRLIDPSIRQNTLLYTRRAMNYRFPQPFENLDVVHPSLFEEFVSRQHWFAKQLTRASISKILGSLGPST